MKFRSEEEIYEGNKPKFYTDGEHTIKLKPGSQIPNGFYPGRTFNANPWNKGLTKETDARVQQCAEHLSNSMQEHVPWNKGLTKETSETVANTGKKISNAVKGRPAWNKGVAMSSTSKAKLSQATQGRPAWNKGLTKETDARVRATSDKLKGHECFVTDWLTAKTKEYETRASHNTFNSSKPEQALIETYVGRYGDKDVLHPYRDNRYPFNCDLYVKTLDLFIEYHGTWLHGGKPFDPNDSWCQAQLSRWQEKALTSDYYKFAIYVWTDLDVRKLNTFRSNHLNFKIIYPSGLTITN